MNAILPILRKLNLLILHATELNQKVQACRTYNSRVWEHILSDFLLHYVTDILSDLKQVI